jgi:hypothetical protein
MRITPIFHHQNNFAPYRARYLNFSVSSVARSSHFKLNILLSITLPRKMYILSTTLFTFTTILTLTAAT